MYQIGHNLTLFDFVHIDNVVHAHLLAASKLLRLSRPSSISISKSIEQDFFNHRLSLVNLTNFRRIMPTSYQTDVTLPSSHRDPPLPLFPSAFSPSPSYSCETPIAGSSFFITNGEPLPFWSFARAVWFAYNGHIPPFKVVLPGGIAMVLARCSEWWGLLSGTEVAMKVSNVRYVTSDLYFDVEKVSPSSLHRFIASIPVSLSVCCF